MARYYYTCPIKAIYMHKEFGVKCLTEIKIEADLKENNFIFYENMTPEITKIYVATESENIFEPQLYDAGFSINPELPFSCLVIAIFEKTGTWAWYNMKHQRWENSHKKDWKIIERDNKQFFMAEVE